ncbi:phage/plasmid-like protein (TIGR03299 family) [Stackebrandtia endophytica]|uniref:Phage/plasmid-like protein (TIGR03299 family) n=1 Tax=Stackebrandtia endophytica TaxID=1496996 RepID=A0A543AS25_9ACTN|nr:DUF932 domain-containing protein [Stackebrandtia endophytica]TQL75378.1 phage/plasmid-like protein (TIGR03299 family) [Stackebrandtia endophytica]
MAHELEQFADGTTAFVSARTPGWHQLGTVTAEAMTGSQALEAARLGDWNVRALRMEGVDVAPDGTVRRIEAPDRRMTVRTNPVTGETDYLGIVSDEYQVIQNEKCAEILDQIVDESGARFETAGSLRGGKSIFITMRMPETITIAGTDPMNLYLAATTSHDASAALRVDATPVRIVCANTQRLAMARSVSHFEFRHTTSNTLRASEARQALGISFKFFDDFQAAAERMMNESTTIDQFKQLCDELWPVPDAATDRVKAAARQRDASLRYLFRDADTNKRFAGTRYGAYQSVVEYVDHFAPASTPVARAQRALHGNGAAIKSQAWQLLAV